MNDRQLARKLVGKAQDGDYSVLYDLFQLARNIEETDMQIIYAPRGENSKKIYIQLNNFVKIHFSG